LELDGGEMGGSGKERSRGGRGEERKLSPQFG